jgi:hypothetical protein
MAADSNSLYEIKIRAEEKDVFVDVKQNDKGVYLKISERNRANRSTILIPASGVAELRDALTAALAAIDAAGPSSTTPKNNRRSNDGPKELEPTKIFVTSLSWDSSNDDMTAFFNSHCGADAVVKAEVLMKRGGRSLGSGIVEFSTVAQAQIALGLTGQVIGGRAIGVRPYYRDN